MHTYPCLQENWFMQTWEAQGLFVGLAPHTKTPTACRLGRVL